MKNLKNFVSILIGTLLLMCGPIIIIYFDFENLVIYLGIAGGVMVALLLNEKVYPFCYFVCGGMSLAAFHSLDNEQFWTYGPEELKIIIYYYISLLISLSVVEISLSLIKLAKGKL